MPKVINQFEDTIPGMCIKMIYDCFVALKPIYDSISDSEKKLLLSVQDDFLWCGTKVKFFYTGLCSKNALSLSNNRRCQQHRYPRLLATEMLFENLPDNLEDFKKLYIKFAQFDYTTSQENKSLIKFQKKGVFVTPEYAYEQCGIELVYEQCGIELVKVSNLESFFIV